MTVSISRWLFVSVVAGVLGASAARAELPSVKLVTAPLVTPANAWVYYTATAVHTDGLAFSATRPAEIKELARSLGALRYSNANYTAAVFEYVRKNVAVEFRFGLSKGALGALIDQSGTAFDQAQLMVELLREGGVSADYQIGQISLTADQFGKWTGLVTGLNQAAQTFSVNQLAACQLLADGGIPATISGATTCTGLTGNLPTTGTPVVMGHIWVRANGTNLYDPSYKTHTLVNGIDLAAAMSCGTAAAPTCASTVQALVPAPQVLVTGVNYVQGSVALDTNVRTQMKTYGIALENSILGSNSTNRRSMTLQELLGGKALDVLAPMPTPAATLPYPSTAQYTLVNPSNIPDKFRTTLRVQFDQINQTFFVDELYGKRLRLWGTPDPQTSPVNRGLVLYLEWKPLLVSNLANATDTGVLTLQADHPYAAISGTYADETLSQTAPEQLVEPGTSNTYLGTMTILHGWGDSDSSLTKYYAEKYQRDSRNLTPENPTDPKHLWLTHVVGPNTDTCAGVMPTTTGPWQTCFESGQSSTVANWLVQSSKMRDLIARVNSGDVQHHHSLGFVVSGHRFQAQYTGGYLPPLFFFNAESSVSANSRTAIAGDRASMFGSTAAAMARAEGGVLEQDFFSSEGGSGAGMIARSVAKGLKLLEVTNTNRTSAMAQTVNYDATTQATVSQFTAGGYSIVLPQDGVLGSFTGSDLVGTIQNFLFNGMVAHNATNDHISYIGMNHLKGSGTTGRDVPDPASFITGTTKNLEYSLKKRDFNAVSLVDGTLKLSPPPDLVTGVGGAPQSLAFQRFYSSSDVAYGYECEAGKTAAGDCIGGDTNWTRPGQGTRTAIGGGWQHNWEIHADQGTDALLAYGRDQALNAAASVSALYVLRGLSASAPSLQSKVATVLASDWWHRSVAANVVNVTRPPSVTSFARSVSQASYFPPVGVSEKLTRTAVTYLPFGTPGYEFKTSSYFLTDRDGAQLKFDLPVADLYRDGYPSSWDFPDGTKIAFTYATGTHCLASVSNNLGRTLSFTTNNNGVSLGCVPGGLTSVQDETGRSVTFSRNTYAAAGGVTPIGSPGVFQVPTKLFVRQADDGVARYDYVINPLTPVDRTSARIFQWFTPGDNPNVGSPSPFMTAEFDRLYRAKALVDNTATHQRTDFYVGAVFGNEQWKRSERQSVVDGANALRTQYFDQQGSLRQDIDELGRATWHYYDGDRRRVRTIFPELNERLSTYDVRHNVLTESVKPKPGSAFANITSSTYTYVEGPGIASCTNAVTCNKVTSVADANGNLTTYSFATTGQLTEVVGPATLAPRTHLCYSSLTASGQTGAISLLVGKIQKVSATEERVTSYSYSMANKLTLASVTVDPATTLLVPTPSTNPSCATATKSTPAPLALTTSVVLDAVGNVQQVDGPRAGPADTTNYIFDKQRRLTTVSQPLSALTRYCYDPDGLTVSENRARIATTDPNALTAASNGSCPTAFPSANWQSTSKSYYPNGDVLATTDAANHTTIMAYDALGRQRVVQDPDGRQTATVYDPAGQVIAVWRGGSNWLTGSGSTTSVSGTAPLASTTWTPSSYAGSGPLRYSYTPSEFVAGFTAATAAYSPNGKRRWLQDANGNQTDFQYDKFDRLWYTFYADPATGLRCTQNAAENTASTTTPAPTCSGGQKFEKIWYTSTGLTGGAKCSGDAEFACRKITRLNQAIAYTYDVLNRVSTKAPAGQGTVTTTYNLASEPISVIEPASGSFGAHSTTYSYDSAGRKTAEVNDSRQVSYQYDTLATAKDNAGSRTRTMWPDGYFVTYSYDALNRMEYVRENSTSTGELAFYKYDTLSRRTDLCVGGQSATCTTTANNKVNYTYEPDSNLDILTQVLGATTVALDYGHNSSGQITSVGSNDAFYLPRPAVSSSTSYSPDKLNRYAAIQSQVPTYDANGNMLTWFPDSTAGSKQTYTFDSENRLVTAAVNAGTTATISYDYDALGRRQKKTVSGTVTQYLLDGDEEIAELDAAGTVLRRYVTGPSIDDRIARAEGAATTNPSKFYYHTNHQGSVMATTDGTGNVGCVGCQRMSYDEYGNLNPAAVTTGEQFRYTGRRFDPETGLYYYRARYYAPLIGRFLQTDPIGYKDDLNLYTYVYNDPLDKTDPTGEQEVIFAAGRLPPIARFNQMGEALKAALDEQPSEAVATKPDGTKMRFPIHKLGESAEKIANRRAAAARQSMEKGQRGAEESKNGETSGPQESGYKEYMEKAADFLSDLMSHFGNPTPSTVAPIPTPAPNSSSTPSSPKSSSPPPPPPPADPCLVAQPMCA